ncbi:MAG: hypothetical protein JRG94_16790 [Deltaproteobacteria bacterium]|nr:hypothetical protein [Deltaproteobacteria bacterium]
MSARNTLPRSTATVLWSLIALGIVLRVLAWGVKGGMHYPDEIFQQLEPAHLLRTGVAWLPWEFGRGLRSWIMPWYYAGLMEVFSWLGVVGHDALRAVNLHNAVLSAAMIPAAFRMGRALCNKSNTAGHSDSAGLWCAALVACWPTVIYFAPHALMGSPSMICLTWGYAFWLEERRASPGGREALWMGFWFGMAGMIRFTSGLHMLVPLADLLLRRRARAIAWLVLGALPGMLTLGLVDLMTWGRPFFSAIEHFRYNFIEGKSSQHGVSPWHFYLTTSFATRVGPGLLLLVPLVLLSLRRSWPVALAFALPTLLLSTVGHKEERFVMHNWPLILACTAVGLVAFEQWLHVRVSRRGTGIAIVAVVACILASNLYGTAQMPWRWRAGIFEAQQFVGTQADATGLLLDDRRHLNGGQLVLSRTIPQRRNDPRWWSHPLFNYAAIKADDSQLRSMTDGGWGQVARFDDVVVLLRRPNRAITSPGAASR